MVVLFLYLYCLTLYFGSNLNLQLFEMEKRIAKILTQYNAIVEEKNSLQDNIELLFTHVLSCVEHIKNQNDISQQKQVLFYELEVLKKLTEINFELENLIESRPLKNCHLLEEIAPIAKLQKPGPSSNESYSQVQTQIPKNDLPNEENSTNNFQTDPIVVESDILLLKNTLKKFTEKMDFHKEDIPCMTDFHNKPSTSTDLCHYTNVSNTNTSEVKVEHFEIPEKDTNTKSLVETNFSEAIFLQEKPECPSITRLEDLCQNESIQSENIVMKLPPTIISKGSSTELLINENVKQVPSQIFESDMLNAPSRLLINENMSDAPCKILSNPTSVFSQISKTAVKLDQELAETDTDSSSASLIDTKLKNMLSSALDKLSKYNIEEIPTVSNIEPLKLPNIMLKSVKLDGANKNRNKKKKNGNNHNVEYALKQKTLPKIGDKCAFSHIESPSEFYIHVVDHESTLIDSITDQINEYFKDTVSEYSIKEIAHNAIGKYCFVYVSNDNGWYRAEVLNWFLEKKTDEVLVILVDFGNKCLTSYKNLRKMIKEIAEIPILSIKCHFPLMYPPDRKSEWPSETIDAMMNLSGLLKFDQSTITFFRIVFAQYCMELKSVAIDLFNPENENEEVTVGQTLLDLRLCEQIVDSIEECDTSLEQFLQDVDILEDAANINEAIMDYDPKDEMRICRFTKPDGTCYKGRNCKLEHTALPKDGFTTDKDPVFNQAMYELILPLPNEAVTVLITGYIDICNFYAQIIRTPHREKKYTIDNALYVLLEDMNSSKVIRTYESFRMPPTVGEIVMTKDDFSKKWLRAVVRDLVGENNDEVHVFTVDFGEYRKVKLTDLRKIKPHFLKLPFQAVNCYIGDYKFKKNCAHLEAKAFFSKNLYFSNFIAYSLSSSLPLKIRLQSMNGFDIGKELLKHGFAEKRIYDRNPLDSCILNLY